MSGKRWISPKRRPGWPAALANLGALYAGRHDFAAARDVWSRSGDPALAVKSALALPPFGP